MPAQDSHHHHHGAHEDTESAANEHTHLLPHSISQGIHPEGESGRSGFSITHFVKITWISSNLVAMYVNLLWPFVPVAIALRYAAPNYHRTIFTMSYVGMIPAANLIGFAGQELARKLPKVSGILIETAMGGMVEIILFLVLIAKHKPDAENAEEGNLVPVIQAAILGSILNNLLLCLGLCFFVGGLRHVEQRFHAAVSEIGTGLLLVAGFGLLIPSAFYSALKSSTVREAMMGHKKQFTEEILKRDILRISQITSILLIIGFIIYIVFNMRTNHSIFDEVLEKDEHGDLDRATDALKDKFTLTECAVALITSIVLVTLLAGYLIEEVEYVVKSGVPDQFLGLILLPLVEKAAEHLTAIDEAWDGLMTALFNAPLVVLISWAIGKPMDLNFEIFMCGMLLLSILVVGNFLRDGTSNYLEGAGLIIIYAIVAVACWYYPDPDVATSNGIGTVTEAVKSVGRMMLRR